MKLLSSTGWAVFLMSLYLFDKARPTPRTLEYTFFAPSEPWGWDGTMLRLALWWMLAAFCVGTVAVMAESTSNRRHEGVSLSTILLSLGSAGALVYYGVQIS